jgi:hypothetical protein
MELGVVTNKEPLSRTTHRLPPVIRSVVHMIQSAILWPLRTTFHVRMLSIFIWIVFVCFGHRDTIYTL